jgi:hypothetical protein
MYISLEGENMLLRAFVLFLAGFIFLPTLSLAKGPQVYVPGGGAQTKSSGGVLSREAIHQKYMEKTCEDPAVFLTTSTSDLACLACGIEKVTEIQPSDKYLALLGMAATRFNSFGPVKNNKAIDPSDGGDAPKIFLMNMIQKIQAFGICGFKTNFGKIPSAKFELVSAAVNGTHSSKNVARTLNGKPDGFESGVGYTSTQQKELMKFFGFKNFDEFSNVFDISGWSNMTLAARREKFNSAINNISRLNPANKAAKYDGDDQDDSNQVALRSCTDEMRATQSKTSDIELCQVLADRCDLNQSFCFEQPGAAPGENQSAPAKGSQPGSGVNVNTGGSGSAQ